MLINRAHIYIFGIPNHHRLMPCTRFWGVKRLPAEKVLKDTVHMWLYANYKLTLNSTHKTPNSPVYLQTTISHPSYLYTVYDIKLLLRLHFLRIWHGQALNDIYLRNFAELARRMLSHYILIPSLTWNCR